MNDNFTNKVTQGDCLDYIPQLTDSSIDLFLSDIPYGISLDDWDVLHSNTNSALLGKSPAQEGKSGFKRRGLKEEAEYWQGWRLGNPAPIWEPVAWFMKPYIIGGTITDNILGNEVGAVNIDECKLSGSSPTNMLEFGFEKNETRIHEAQKPLALIEYLIKLTTQKNQLVLDPFMGNATVAIAAKNLQRNFIGFEIHPEFHKQSLERIKKVAADSMENFSLSLQAQQPLDLNK